MEPARTAPGQGAEAGTGADPVRVGAAARHAPGSARSRPCATTSVAAGAVAGRVRHAAVAQGARAGRRVRAAGRAPARRRRARAAGVSPALFAQAARGGRAARARAACATPGGGVEVTLAEIHERAAGLAVLPRAVERRRAGARPSAALERELLVCDLDVVELVRDAAGRGRRVVAVSDTYFSEAQLRRFIGARPAGGSRRSTGCSSPARHGTGKATGLFSIVLRASSGCEPAGAAARRRQPLLRRGRADRGSGSARSTSSAARRRWSGSWSASACSTRAALDPVHGDDGLAGAARQGPAPRARATRQPEGLRPFWRFGAASLGPVLTGFAEWVQAEAARAGASGPSA